MMISLPVAGHALWSLKPLEEQEVMYRDVEVMKQKICTDLEIHTSIQT